jgi:hypothetical protein
MRKQPSPYGICHRCQSPIGIPGLEAFKCGGGCEWVPRKSEPKLEPSEAQKIKVISFVRSEPKQLELLGQGGGV